MPEIQLGQPIAQGRTADVYAWRDGYVIKVFHDWFELGDIKYEARLAQAVHAAGVEAPWAGDIVQTAHGYGLIYRRVDGPSMLMTLQRKPWLLFDCARRLARLHAQMHTCTIGPAIPDQRSRLTNKIRRATGLPARLRSSALAALDALPDGDRVCHGDLHPGNVLTTGSGDVAIDWIDAARGNPLADVARTTIIALGSAASEQITARVMKAAARLFHGYYLRHYFRLRPGGEAEHRRWLPVVAAARLSEGIPELEGWLIAQASQLE